MKEYSDKIDSLLDKLESLLKRQEAFSEEVNEVREEIYRFKANAESPVAEKEKIKESPPVIEKINEIRKDRVNTNLVENQRLTDEKSSGISFKNIKPSSQIKTDLEKFIGENLINKIGIGITVVGVAIGTKYAIDHQLINPVTRIILGYLMGFGLLIFAVRLKKRYENFSAVLLSGSMAIMYFITYSAYSFYYLLPQNLSFILMVLITVFTVTAAIKYDSQVIAHIGLVGAYAVPFLLSKGSENVSILFSYTAIINIGILFISFKKYWKPLYYSSFLLTWLMYLLWFASKYQSPQHTGIATTFLSVFFVTFYLMILAYKLVQKEKFNIYDIVLLLSNSFIFYGIGYNIINRLNNGESYLGLFTLGNATVHLIVSMLIFRNKLADRNLFYLISGLSLVFITIAIPVQLNGNWVTLLWVGEAALLFWLGRTKNVSFYEVLSYFLMLLAFLSLLNDWAASYNMYNPLIPETKITPLLNIYFLTSLLFIAASGFIIILNRNPKFRSPLYSQTELVKLFSFSVAIYFLISLYYSFSLEISNYWNQRYADSLISVDENGNTIKYRNSDLQYFKTIWLINYSLFLFSILSLVNIRKLRYRKWGFINLIINTLILLVFLIPGLYILSELRESYLNQTLAEYYNRTPFNIVIRYISFGFVGLMLTSIYMYVRQDFLKPAPYNLRIAFELILNISLIWIISSEFISWMDIFKYSQSYKLVLSILWGVYALLLIVYGIWKNKKHLRIFAITLFGVTLIKLFFYDISHLDTISKTIVFVTLGIILLIISFLYNKYKNIISEEIQN